jgi:hypothetical protein
VTARPIKVTRMAEGDGYMVARTDDVEAARQAAREHVRADAPTWYAPEDVQDSVDGVDRLIPRVGWYRWTPCHESSCFDGGGHSGHLGYANGPGRGVFRGVYLQGSM